MSTLRLLPALLFGALCAGACGSEQRELPCTGEACTSSDDSDDADDDDVPGDDSAKDAGRSGEDAKVAAPDAARSLPPRDAGVASTPRDAGSDATSAPPPSDAGDAPPPVPMGGPAKMSAGCGNAMPPEAGTKTIDIDGTMREYIVALPQSYDPNRPYRLIFAWHGLGGTAASIARSWYGLQRRADNSAIFVAGQGLPTQNMGGAGWPNTGGRDVAFVQKLTELLRSSYCVDETRIFSTGMSYGGIMSNTLGCQMGDVFRAIAPMAGSGPLSFRGGTCKGQPAAWITHGNTDTVVQYSAGQASRDHWLQTNHCEMQSMPTTPSPCVAYQGCDDGHPVHWCEFAGGHTVPPFAAEAIWSFFAQF